VDFAVIEAGCAEESKESNAQYVISVARKIGCTAFNLPDDITEVRPKMLAVLVGLVMLVHLQSQ